MSIQVIVRAAAAASLLALSMGMTSEAGAAERAGESAAGTKIVHFDISAQPLNQALNSFAQQADLRIVFDTAVAERLTSPALTGELTPVGALERLLAGSSLTYRFTDSRTVAIDTAARPTAGSSASEVGKPVDEKGNDMRLAQQKSQETTESSQGTAQESGAVEKLEEIVVTAQKRKQRLQDVPISITALSGEELDRSTLTGVHEILSRVPGVALTRDWETNGMQLTVRGVTSSGARLQGSSPIAYYLDSIPFGFVRNAYVPDVGSFDLDRIEVLRGPQGTLYGAGGEGGVVRVLTHEADLDKFEFKTRTSLSSTSGGGTGYRGDAAINVPIIEGKLAARVVAGYEQIPGWIDRADYTLQTFQNTGTLDGPVIKRDANEGNQRNLRLKVDARPTEQLSIGVSAWNSLIRYDAPQIGDNNNHTPALRSEPSRDSVDAYSLKADYDFGAFSLSSMSSYVDYSASAFSRSAQDYFRSGNSFDIYMTSRVLSEEVVLNSRIQGPWRWSGGMFYRDAEDDQYSYFGPDHSITYYSGKLIDLSKQTAVFGEVGRRFWSDKWEWSLGLRYFRDNVKMRDHDNVTLVAHTADSFTATTPRAMLTWHPKDSVMVYGTYGQGFRSGIQQTGLIARIAPEIPAAKPDKLSNYEIGAKGDLWDRRISFETALYYLKWKDTQQTLAVLIPNQPALVGIALANAGSVSGRGMDIAVTLRPLKRLEVGLNYSVNDLTFDEDVHSGGDLLFSKGDRLGSSPEYTLNPFAAYSFPFGASGYRGRFSADLTYVSPPNIKKLGDPNGVDGAPVKLARAGFSLAAPQHWNVSLNVDNLNNYQSSASPFINIEIFSFISYRERPRTVNLQFEYQFN